VCVTARLFFDPVPMAKTAKPSAGPRANGFTVVPQVGQLARDAELSPNLGDKRDQAAAV